MASFRVVYDASVLYPAPLRDFLMELALSNLFAARWTEEIHDEWIRNVLKNRPDLTLERLTRTKNLMNAKVEGCLVTGYEVKIPELQLPDMDDCHVLAAAIHCDASYIVTFNLRDFRDTDLTPYGVQALHPDKFILHLLELDSMAVCQAAQRQRSRLKNPPKAVKEYLETLQQQGLTLTAMRLREVCQEI
ncbi:PIN domain-containing protein [Scytonema sp. NUACC26]|uniref:PIN domain-containing protein n=1 Tax=Scytonema sp. NUACC26 TaxID=3140176 RepID=UPI0034DCB235